MAKTFVSIKNLIWEKLHVELQGRYEGMKAIQQNLRKIL